MVKNANVGMLVGVKMNKVYNKMHMLQRLGPTGSPDTWILGKITSSEGHGHQRKWTVTFDLDGAPPKAFNTRALKDPRELKEPVYTGSVPLSTYGLSGTLDTATTNAQADTSDESGSDHDPVEDPGEHKRPCHSPQPLPCHLRPCPFVVMLVAMMPLPPPPNRCHRPL